MPIVATAQREPGKCTTLMTVPYDNFAKIYDRWIDSGGEMMGTIRDFYVARFGEQSGVIVELGVGNGRILVELAKRGRTCVGVDYSRGMLDLCHSHLVKAGVEGQVELIQGDFREFRLAEPAAVILIPYDSIGHMPTHEAKLACFRNVRENLAPGGTFAFDQQIFAPEKLKELDRAIRLRDNFVDAETGQELFIFSTMVQNFAEKRYRSTLWLERFEDGAMLSRHLLGTVDNSWTDPEDMRQALEAAGLEVTACLGSFKGEPFGPAATHQIWFTRRPAA